MTNTTAPSENSRVLRNGFVGLLGVALIAAAWLLWWPISIGVAIGATNVLVRPDVPRLTRFALIAAVAAVIAAGGFFGGAIGVAVAGMFSVLPLALKA